MKRSSVLIIIAALSMAALSGIALKGKRPGESGPSVGPSMEGLRIVNKEEGEVLWAFTSARAAISEDGAIADLKTVEVNFPKREVGVTADGGTYDMRGNDLSLRGGVRAVSAGYSITTDTIMLRGGREISTDDKVVIEAKGLKIEGRGLRAKENAWVLKNVKALVY